MPFTVPNAIDYNVSIASLEQAEPDKLDFAILGDRRSGVISGASVTNAVVNGSAYIDVTLSSAEVLISGNYGSIASSTITISAPPSTGTRFDIICAQYTAPSTYSYVVITGVSSASNPVFPAPSSTQIPLYAVIVRSGLTSGTTANLIVDKRVLLGSVVQKYGSTTPVDGTSGDLYYRVGSSPATGQSTLWFNNSGTWENLSTFTFPPATAATANTLVQRDASGNFSANTITASLNGNAATVTNGVYNNGSTYNINISGSAARLTTARTIQLTGNVTGSQTFDGSGNITINTTLDPAVPTAKSIAIGTTTTGAAGTSASVTVTQTASTATLSFTIPQGIKGDTGATGAQGPKGDTGATGAKGDTGAQGPAGGFNAYSNNNIDLWVLGTYQQEAISIRTFQYSGYDAIALRDENLGQRFYVTSLGQVRGTGNYATVSDRTMKENIEYVDMDTLSGAVSQLKPARFNFIGSDEVQMGFIAQDVEPILPDAIIDMKGKLGLDMTPIIASLVAAVQELSAKVKTLESQISK